MSPHRVANVARAVSAGALVVLLVVGVRGTTDAGDARLVTHLTSSAAIPGSRPELAWMASRLGPARSTVRRAELEQARRPRSRSSRTA